jgi:protein O-GlcNAcase/histone acetyltransferase
MSVAILFASSISRGHKHPFVRVNEQFLSGVVEGFYGQPWSAAERFQLFDWMRDWGLNTYVYAPKDDLKHRALWRELYSVEELAPLRDLVRRATSRGIQFIYALAPGLDIRYARRTELDCIKERFNQMLSIGCQHYALLFDDLADTIDPEDAVYYGSFAGAHAHVTNDIFQWTRQRSPKARFLFCPTPYCGRMAQRQLGGPKYLETLGRELLPGIDVFWTGPEIISASIHGNDLPEDLLGRKPVLWDNLHANDYDRSRFYCGPYSGRDPQIRSKTKGILTNPNNEFPLNFIPIRTLAMFLQSQEKWEPRRAFLQALAEWEPHFKTVRAPITLDHLRAFVDCFYLPHEDGPEAREFANNASLAIQQKSERAAKEFTKQAALLREFCQRATELKDRKLFYALAQRIWDLREEVDLVERYIATSQENAGPPFVSDFHLPKTYRGGFVRRLRTLLDQKLDGSFVPRSVNNEITIRAARPGDQPGAYYVCLKTGDYGKDGEPFYRDDPEALGRIFVGPYLAFEPELSLLLEDEDGICGYALGAFDSHKFYHRYEKEWRPRLCADFPMPNGDPAHWTRVQHAHSWYHQPDYFCPEPYDAFPSHLHIDLLPRAQGRGFGRRMLQEVMRRLRERGSPGAHLGVSAVNASAHEFYKHLGFLELTRAGTGASEVIYMGQRFSNV